MQWFDLFCDVLTCSDGFRKQAEAQLRRHFREETGLTLSRFVLAPPIAGPAEIGFESDGSARLDTRLHGPDAYSFEVSIGWRCPGRERLLPSDPKPCDELEAWWRELPADSLSAHYAKPSGPPWPVSDEFPFDPARYSFKVDWEHSAWPDLSLRVETDRAADSAARDSLVAALERARQSWNAAAEAGAASGIIHNLGAQAKVAGARAVVVDVDFGSTGPKALIVMLDILQTLAGKLGIRRIRIGGP